MNNGYWEHYGYDNLLEFINDSAFYDNMSEEHETKASLGTDEHRLWLGEVNEDIDSELDRERLLGYFTD
jgi:hypothetical protein